MKPLKQSIIWGTGAAAGLLLLFVLVVRVLSGSFGQVRLQFDEIGIYLIVLAIGFGVQIGLWRYLKLKHVQHMKSHGIPALSGATSGVAMLACCSHYFVTILPFLGLVGIAGILTTYQIEMLTASIGLNLFGIAYMVYQLQKVRTISNELACHTVNNESYEEHL